jgi:DNA-directed RNA polymerase specialized sigma24 family protein
VLVLRYFEDLTEVETARVLGISPGTVKSTNRQALSKLRALAPELAELVGVLPGGDQ